jgi:hypothetical protein
VVAAGKPACERKLSVPDEVLQGDVRYDLSDRSYNCFQRLRESCRQSWCEPEDRVKREIEGGAWSRSYHWNVMSPDQVDNHAVRRPCI